MTAFLLGLPFTADLATRLSLRRTWLALLGARAVFFGDLSSGSSATDLAAGDNRCIRYVSWVDSPIFIFVFDLRVASECHDFFQAFAGALMWPWVFLLLRVIRRQVR